MKKQDRQTGRLGGMAGEQTDRHDEANKDAARQTIDRKTNRHAQTQNLVSVASSTR